MLSKAAKDLIIGGLPATVVVSGHTINVAKRYANQYTYEKFPAVTLEYGRCMTSAAPSLDDNTRETDHTKQTLVYVTGTTSYTLEKNFVMDIDEVVGVVGGVKYTFLPAEYELTGGTHPYHEYIHFLGATFPDNGTSFDVTFHHAWFRKYVGGLFTETLTINIWAKDVEVVKPGGGKTVINGILVADQLAEDVWKWLKYDAEDVASPCPFALRDIGNVMILDSQVVGEEIRRRQIEMDVLYINEWERTSKETIEDTEVTMNTG